MSCLQGKPKMRPQSYYTPKSAERLCYATDWLTWYLSKIQGGRDRWAGGTGPSLFSYNIVFHYCYLSNVEVSFNLEVEVKHRNGENSL